MPRFALFVVLALACLGAAPRPAEAASCSASIQDLEFGDVDTLGPAPSDTVANVRIDCTDVSAGASAVSACVHLGPGSGGEGAGLRRLAAGSRGLDVQLYADSGRSLAWGSAGHPGLGDPVRLVAPASGGTAGVAARLYGRVFGAQQGVGPGSYASVFTGADARITYAEGAGLDCGGAGAGTAETTFAVRARVLANCLVEASDIDFGQHGLIDRNIDASGAIGITCTPGTDYSVTLGAGLHGTGGPEARVLRSGTDQAIYGLYRDGARTQPWGSSLETRLPGTGAGTRQAITVYGRVPPQRIRPGTYSDSVAVTITYDNVPAF